MKPIRGKNIVAADYEPVDGILSIQFSKSGIYKWSGVPENVWVSLQRSPFPDSYFSKVVKGQFPVVKPEKIEPEKEAKMEMFLAKDGLSFEPGGHRYALKGQPLISLTQVIDAAGLVDYSMVQPDVLANKAKFGTRVHEYCLWADQGELDWDDLKPYTNYYNRVQGWMQFTEDFNFVPSLEWCEVPCAVKVNGMTYAMTIDRFGVSGPAVGGSPTIVEIKTCADREPSHQIQTAAQAIPFKGDGSVPLKRYAVYLLDKPNQANRNYFCQPHDDRNDERHWMWALGLTQLRINNGLLKVGK